MDSPMLAGSPAPATNGTNGATHEAFIEGLVYREQLA